MTFRKTEMHKMLDETQYNESMRSFPIADGNEGEGKPHRFSFNIGCFNDGLRSSFCKHVWLMCLRFQEDNIRVR